MHGVILMDTSGQVRELFPGELIDPLDNLESKKYESELDINIFSYNTIMFISVVKRILHRTRSVNNG